MSITLSAEQSAVVEHLLSWVRRNRPTRDDAPFITLGGLAGTGKTTIIKELVRLIQDGLGRSVAVCAPTGKAAHVLTRKGAPASTIHSLIYTPFKNENGRVEFIRVPSLSASVVIIDEGSMISTDLWEDLRSFGVPLIVVGDHGQLEPVGDNPELLVSPMLRLETIMRQALSNPIIALAHRFRAGEEPWGQPAYDYTEDNTLGYSTHSDLASLPFIPDIVITAYNKQRVTLNKLIRSRIFDIKTDEPIVGDRIICLRNDAEKNIFNGMIGEITSISIKDAFKYNLSFLPEGATESIPCVASRLQFNSEKGPGEDAWYGTQYFDFARAITAHKSQGSEWDNVCVMEQQNRKWSMPRWRYTAATRAAKRLAYIA